MSFKLSTFSWSSLQLAAILLITAGPMCGLSVYLFHQSIESEDRLVRIDTGIIAQTAARRLHSFSRNRVLAMKLAEAYFESSNKVDDDEFERYMGSVLAEYPEFASIGYADGTKTVRQMAPSRKSPIDPQQIEEVVLHQYLAEVVACKQSQVISRIPLTRGGAGVGIFRPVLKNGKVDGVLFGAVPLPEGLTRVLGDEVKQYWSFRIFDESGAVLYSVEEPDSKELHEPHEAVADFPFGEKKWTLHVWPKQALLNTLRTSSPERILLCGAATTIVLIFGVSLLFWRQRSLKNALEETRRAHRTVAESEKRFRELMERTQLLGMVFDPHWRLTFCNDKFLEISGYRRAEVIGTNILERFVPPEEAEACRVLYREVTAKNTPVVSTKNHLITRTGSLREIAWNHVVSYDQHGNVEAVTSLGDDITDRLASEEAQRQSQKLESLGVLAGGIAHDFNNLLTTIIGHNDLALKKAGSSSPLKEHLDNVGRTARRLADLTAQMLAYSGRGRIEVGDVDINRLVRELSDLMRVSIPKRVEIQYDLQQQLPLIEADSMQIEQVLLNLMTNAAESIPNRSGRIILRTRLREIQAEELDRLSPSSKLEPGSYIELSVQDNGSGIEPEKLSRIFDPFFTTKFTGRGLGLAVLQGIVRGHGGAVNVESQVGVGTTFHVFLPIKNSSLPSCVPVSMTASSPEEKNHAPLRKRLGEGTVLVIDDEDSVRHLASEILKMTGFKTLEARDGEGGLELYRANRREIVAVLLDLTMPGMGGQATYTKLQEIDPAVRIVLTSGYTTHEIERQFQDTPVAGFVQKPFLPSELIKWIFEAVEPQENGLVE